MVGSINDKHGTELVAFRTGERVTLDYLNSYAKPENRVDVNKPFSPSKMTRAEAREAYPEWYERVVVRGEKGRKTVSYTHLDVYKRQDVRSGTLPERCRVMIRMRSTIGGCGRSER